MDERIFDLYDIGKSIQEISKELDTTTDYIASVLKNASVEAT